jgi:RNA polymerase sigma-70 factor (ECF subfamily)
METSAATDVRSIVGRLARAETRRLVASLLRATGGARLALAEDCVQDAFVSALRIWPETGVPDDPFAWVLRAAHNRAIDIFRHAAMKAAVEPKLIDWIENLQSRSDPSATGDDEVSLLFLCCHPALEEEARLALTLKCVSGFSVPEIARAFLTTNDAIAQRIVRAKAKVRDRKLEFEMPAANKMGERMPSVLKTIYLLFNEGYAPADGEAVVRGELCAEALSLIGSIASNPNTAAPEAHALAALLNFQHARHGARTDCDGAIVLLADHDRSLWDKGLIAQGFTHMRAAMQARELSAYHLEAGIASVHAAARSWEETDWPQILRYYDMLHEIAPSPVAAVNRAVAIAMASSPAAALAALRKEPNTKSLNAYPSFHMARAELLLRSGDRAAAAAAFETVLTLTISTPERLLIERKLAGLRD